MCSIFGMFGLQAEDDPVALRRLALELSQRQRHRGPDWSGVYQDETALLVHERLAIVDPAGGSQPIRSADGELALAVNGEIYNHRQLEQGLGTDYAREQLELARLMSADTVNAAAAKVFSREPVIVRVLPEG